MKSNYKKLGQFIRQTDERNKEMLITNLQGVSISKTFMPSIANIIGTDLTNYKIVRTGQFAYGPVTSRNGDKISVALLQGDDCIISSSYIPFEIYKKEELLAEYLMLWFSRPEFDRYARYMSNGSAREVFDWDCLCNTFIPVPSIEEQKRIIDVFASISERIALLSKINETLINQARSIFMSFSSKPSRTKHHLSEVADINPDSFLPDSEWDVVNYLDTSGIVSGYINSTQIIKKTSDKLPSRARRKIKAGDIVFSTVRPNQRHYGIIFNPAPNMVCSTGFAVIRSKMKKIPNELLYLAITADSFVESMHQLAEQRASTFPAIKPLDLDECLISAPNEDDELLIETIRRIIDCSCLYFEELKHLYDLRTLLVKTLLSSK